MPIADRFLVFSLVALALMALRTHILGIIVTIVIVILFAGGKKKE